MSIQQLQIFVTINSIFVELVTAVTSFKQKGKQNRNPIKNRLYLSLLGMVSLMNLLLLILILPNFVTAIT